MALAYLNNKLECLLTLVVVRGLIDQFAWRLAHQEHGGQVYCCWALQDFHLGPEIEKSCINLVN